MPVCIFLSSQALLELLDQVEDAISVEDSEPSTVNSSKTQDGNGYDMPCNAGSLVKEAAIDPPESVAVPLSNYNFLVLEVIFAYCSTCILILYPLFGKYRILLDDTFSCISVLGI